MTNVNDKFRRRVLACIAARGLTQEQAATLCGMRRQTLYWLLERAQDIPLSRAKQIADGLELNFANIFRNSS